MLTSSVGTVRSVKFCEETLDHSNLAHASQRNPRGGYVRESGVVPDPTQTSHMLHKEIRVVDMCESCTCVVPDRDRYACVWNCLIIVSESVYIIWMNLGLEKLLNEINF